MDYNYAAWINLYWLNIPRRLKTAFNATNSLCLLDFAVLTGNFYVGWRFLVDCSLPSLVCWSEMSMFVKVWLSYAGDRAFWSETHLINWRLHWLTGESHVSWKLLRWFEDLFVGQRLISFLDIPCWKEDHVGLRVWSHEWRPWNWQEALGWGLSSLIESFLVSLISHLGWMLLT